MTEPTVYDIPAENYTTLSDKLAKLSKRAVKLGFAPIVLTVVREEMREVADEITGVARLEKHIHVTVTGDAPKLNGWTFVATIHHAGEAGNIILAVAGQEVPAAYRDATPEWCDHCKTSRRRNDTYVVRHDDGRTAQVGSTCLKDFLGHADPQALASMAELLAGLDGVVLSFGEGNGSGEAYFDLAGFLALTASVIEQDGWLSKTKAYEQGLTGAATANIVWGLALDPRDQVKRSRYGGIEKDYRPTDAHVKLAIDAAEWARVWTADPGDNDYKANLRVVCNMDYVERRTAGLAASIVSVYQREMQKEVEKALKGESPSEHVGSVGEKLSGLVLTLTGCNFHEGFYGTSAIHNFVDASGNVFSWFCTTGEQKFDIGQTVTVNATVKGHKVYRDTKQTDLKLVREAKAKK